VQITFENAIETNHAFSNFLIADMVICYCAILRIMLSLIQYELGYSMEIDEDLPYEHTIKSILIICTVVDFMTSYALVVRYLMKVRWWIKKKHISELESLQSTGLWKTCIIEVLISFIGPHYWL
jgi:hypothetical protein